MSGEMFEKVGRFSVFLVCKKRIEARRKITIEKIFSPEADLLKEQFPCFKELL